MTNNIDSAITYLKDLNASKSFEVIIPSSQKPVKFKQLNTQQLKQILETITDTTVFNNNFNYIFLNILKQNILTADIEIKDLNIYDIYYLALQIRSNSLSETYTSYFSEEEVEAYNLTDTKYEINLKKLLNSKTIRNVLNEEIIEDNINVICQTPTVQNENDYMDFFNNLVKTSIIKDVQKIIGEIFIYEIVKSIKSVNINGTSINFNDVPFESRIKIVNQFSTTLTTKIITFIEKYKAALYDLYLVEIETEIEGSKFFIQKQLQYNANLFNY
jgi:hypothetical protein